MKTKEKLIGALISVSILVAMLVFGEFLLRKIDIPEDPLPLQGEASQQFLGDSVVASRYKRLASYYYRKFKFQFLDISSHSEVILGSEGWLFFNGKAFQGGKTSVEDYLGLNVLPQPELEKWKNWVEAKRDFLEKQGVSYLLVYAPEKTTIYPEYLPKRFDKVGKSAGEQHIEYLSKHSTVAVLDLSKPLLEAKNKERVYYKTDSHWNDMGAFIGYQAIIRKLNQMNPGYNLKSFDRSDFKVIYRKSIPGDLGHIIGARELLREDYVDLIPIKPKCGKPVLDSPQELIRDNISALPYECGESERKLLMFRDSFSNNLIPHLIEHFERSVFILNKIKTLAFLKKAVDFEKPDLVIEEIGDRKIGCQPKSQPGATC
jgi:alginate O-acetyltransferase complex protein AlgJ